MKSRRRIASPKAQDHAEIGRNYSRDLRLAERGPTIILRGNNPNPLMFALGQKQTFSDVSPMSALPPRKRTLGRVLDMIESVGKVLKLLEHHHEISP
jgi:hypothetical protein